MLRRIIRNIVIVNLIIWLLLAAYAIKQDHERLTPAEVATKLAPERAERAKRTPTPCPYANLTNMDMMTTPYENLDFTRTC